MKYFLQISFFIIILSCSKQLSAQEPIISFQSVATGLSTAVDIANAGDASNRLFIVQQSGIIRIWQNGAILPTAFLNISSVVLNNGEQGLLSLAFHPDYKNNRYFFVYYNNLAGAITLARYRTDINNPSIADPASAVVLLTITKPFTNHNGGKLNFGKDGKLYFGTGDGGSGGDPNNLSQNGNSLLGKMIRLNVDNFTTPPYYTIPADNPYTADPNVRDEIWAIGLRNPWRWSFDKQTGDMWIADVGQGLWEEINYRVAGTTGGINYGWRCYEGNHAFNTTGCLPQASYVPAIFEYPHNNATGGFSVTGGYIYRGTEFPFLNGYYFFADYVSGNGWTLKSNGAGGWNATQKAWPGGISTFGEAENGALYAATLSGTLYKINALNPVPLRLILFTAKDINGTAQLHWVTEDENIAKQFEVQQSPDGINFTQIGTVAAINTPVTNSYNFNYTPVSVYYRLKMVDLLNNFTYSPIVKISRITKQVYPNIISNGVLNIYPTGNLKAVNIFDALGRKVLSVQYNNAGALIQINVSTFAKGIYWVKMDDGNNLVTEKIMILK